MQSVTLESQCVKFWVCSLDFIGFSLEESCHDVWNVLPRSSSKLYVFLFILSCWRIYYENCKWRPWKDRSCIEIAFLGKILISWSHSENSCNCYFAEIHLHCCTVICLRMSMDKMLLYSLPCLYFRSAWSYKITFLYCLVSVF